MSTEKPTQSACLTTEMNPADRIKELESELYILRMENQQNEMLSSTVVDVKNKRIGTLETEITRLKMEISNCEKQLTDQQQLLDNASEDRKKMDSLLEEQRKKVDVLEKELSSLKYKQTTAEIVASVSKGEVEKSTNNDKEKFTYSPMTLETEIKQLRDLNERLRKEVRTTRDCCRLEVQKARKEAANNPQVVQYAETVKSIAQGCELKDDLMCTHCGITISNMLDTGSTECTLCQGLLEVHRVYLKGMEYKEKLNRKEEELMSLLDLKYKGALQIRDIALVLLVVAIAVISSIRF